MKIFKIILFIIFLVLLAVFGIQNQGYFLTGTPLYIDFKVASLNYKVMDLPNWGYWALCLVLGLLITGIRGLITAFRLRRQVRTRDERIESMKGEINSLQTRLDIFIHDPYIKKHLEEEARKDKEQAATEEKKKD
ncbi:MAG TPA: hypothetical protein DCR95_12060 [Desulfobacter sp.]|jgi:hypothetical protein|uniref:hypothetical protein n=1 Tax=unclassified Desulfobacter TaxID=2634406 RepID=UPI000E87CBC3|nr:MULTISPECIES: hypothetical protein [unclassified Desulfobacter]MBP9598059.1 hypothetical protein [Desulfobacter sp.]HAR34782.1 hypothetical protein [Desulfobacter sp.]HBT89319.1 hypothetical protein [Desulfobacter sp.]